MDMGVVKGISLVLFAYILGSVPFGLLVAKAFDRSVDLRNSGSGNIGATNVARTVGKGAGVVTLLFDVGKAVFVLLVTKWLVAPDSAPLWLSLVGAAVFLGHVFSLYLNFRGGKGIATALGVVLFLSPVTAFVLVVVFAGVFYATRFVSLASLCAAVALPIMAAFLVETRHALWLSLLICFVAVWTHRDNVRRLLAGTESRFGST